MKEKHTYLLKCLEHLDQVLFVFAGYLYSYSMRVVRASEWAAIEPELLKQVVAQKLYVT